MIAAWMLYATVVGALLAAGALAADAACRLLRLPRRGVWAAALVATVTLPVAAATLGAVSRTAAPGHAAGAAVSVVTPTTAPGAPPSTAAPHTTPRAWSPPSLTIGPAHPLRALDRPLAALWIAGTAAGALALLVGARRLARARRGWQPLGTDAGRVLVSDAYGPAVAGVRRPVVVVPRWTLALAPDDLALVVAHERSHLEARDPLLLAAALATLLALPWLLPLWFVVVRLRLAVESDCDRRVLRAHPRPDVRRYGRLLVDVAERALSPRPARAAALPNAMLGGSLGLLDPPGALEARVRGLLAPAPNGRAWAYAAALLAGAGGAAALACESPRPRSAPTEPDARPSRVASTVASTVTAPTPERATIDSLRAQVETLTAKLDRVSRSRPAPAPAPAPEPPRVHVEAPTDAELRADVRRAAPGALTGAMGHRAYVWLLYDSASHVAESATGLAGMLTQGQARTLDRNFPLGGPDTAHVLDASGVYRTFLSLHEAQLHSFGWRVLPAGADSVNVIWVRPTSLGWKLSDFDEAPRDAAGASRRSRSR